jgi:hypothetical protein
MRYLTTTEAATIVHIDPNRVRLLRQRNLIKTIKIGNIYDLTITGRCRGSFCTTRPPSAIIPRANRPAGPAARAENILTVKDFGERDFGIRQGRRR